MFTRYKTAALLPILLPVWSLKGTHFVKFQIEYHLITYPNFKVRIIFYHNFQASWDFLRTLFVINNPCAALRLTHNILRTRHKLFLKKGAPNQNISVAKISHKIFSFQHLLPFSFLNLVCESNVSKIISQLKRNVPNNSLKNIHLTKILDGQYRRIEMPCTICIIYSSLLVYTPLPISIV